MPGLLANEIKQSVPFASAEIEAFLNLIRTTDGMRRDVSELLRPHCLSAAGYNVLRILRGAGTVGLPCSEVAQRLISHDPDVTRLADRLIKAGFVARERPNTDRRVVVLRITDAGLALLTQLDDQLANLHQRQLAHLGSERLASLIGLLEQARNPATNPLHTQEHP
ncbi:MAG: MarR family transcriptional regulator [Planctomycetota bacterium]